MYGLLGTGRIGGMDTPHRPEADMLHMQHAHVVALLIRQHEAGLQKARRDAAKQARPVAGYEPAPARTTRNAGVRRTRPA